MQSSIKDWAEDDKPREKLLLKGKMALSDAELIAVLLRSGSRQENVVDLSKRILAETDNNLSELGKMSFDELIKFHGVGEAKAVSIIAALELGRRRRLEEAAKKLEVTSSRAVFEFMQPLVGDLDHEEFWVIYLNNSNKVIKQIQLSVGGFTATLVDVRIVFKKALELNATAVILCHNHPSGKLAPSKGDRDITAKLVEASRYLDIKVLDHLIVTERDYFSFSDHNLL